MTTIYSYLKSCWNYFTPFITRGVLIYGSFIMSHYIAANLYPRMCTPITFVGFIMSPFMVITPHCEALRWIIGYTGSQMRNMWFWMGGYLILFVENCVREGLKDKNTENMKTRSHKRSE